MKSMIKRGLAILLAITIIFGSAYVGIGQLDFNGINFNGLFAVKAKAVSESDLTFTLNEDGQSYSVTDCSYKSNGQMTIPSTYNDLPVTSIGGSAFSYCERLTSKAFANSLICFVSSM